MATLTRSSINYNNLGDGVLSWGSQLTTWNFVSEEVPGTQVKISNNDGTFTVLTGTGFTFDGSNNPTGGDVDLVERYASNSTLIETISLLPDPYDLVTDFFANIANDVGGLMTGADNVQGGNSNLDILYGYSGADTFASGVLDFSGGLAFSFMVGGSGNDTFTLNFAVVPGTELFYFVDYALEGGPSGVTVNLGTGTATDTFVDTDTIFGVRGIVGTNFADSVTGDFLDNVLTVGGGKDTVDGGGGFDILEYSFNEFLKTDGFGFQGSITVNYTSATSGTVFDPGTDGTDGPAVAAANDSFTNIEEVWGTRFIDTFNGSAGNEVMAGMKGGDIYNGGGGVDTVDYSVESFEGGTLGVIVNLGTTVQGGINPKIGFDTFGSADSLNSIESIVGSIFGDQIYGGTAAEFYDGREGDDLIAGRGGADTIDGGDGNDTADYSASTAAVTVTLGIGGAQTKGVGGEAANDLISNIERITGSNFNDTLKGNELVNTIAGGIGNDSIEGGAGGDTLDGDTGTSDTLSYASDTTGVEVDLFFNTAQGAGSHADGDTVSGFENATGGSGNDLIAGNDGNNKLIGGAGILDMVSYFSASAGVTVSLALTTAQNTVNAGTDTISGFEDLTGSDFNDILTGSTGNNVVNGLKGDDNIKGGGGLDTIFGDEGDDTIEGGAGIDTLNGGETDETNGDTLSYSASTVGVTVDLSGVDTATGGDATGDVIADGTFENIVGSGKVDTLRGDAGINIIEGGLGNDTIDFSDGGTDTLSYASASAAVKVKIQTGAQVTGGGGTDNIIGIFANLIGGKGADTLTGDANINVIKGGDGNDTIEGAAGGDTLDGGAGVNTLSYASDTAGVFVSLGSGGASGGDAESDLVTFASFQNLVGGSGVDQLGGSDSVNNRIDGGAGDDFVFASTGNDTLLGGGTDINDTVSFALLIATGVKFNLATTTAQNIGATVNIGSQIITGFENVVGTYQDDVLTGTAGANFMNGLVGDDIIKGLAGADTINGSDDDDLIEGGAGADTLIGGEFGDVSGDTLSYAASAMAVKVDLSLAIQAEFFSGAILNGDASLDSTAEFENILGSAKNDILIGDTNANTIEGGLGNDTITGGGGDDTLSYASATAKVTVALGVNTAQATGGGGTDTIADAFLNLIGGKAGDKLNGDGDANIINGGDGDDTIEGGVSGDTLSGGNGKDTVSYASDTAGVTVRLGTLTTTGGDAGGDSISGFENVTGGAGDDVIGGDGGNNTLIGGANGVVGDTVTYIEAGAAVTVNLALTTAQNTVGAGTDTISGFENINGSGFNDILTGNNSANLLNGFSGDDRVIGGGGDDNLIGGVGLDTMIGGAGNDMMNGALDAVTDAFVFNTALNAATNVDSILNYEVGIDQIQLDNAIFTKLGANGALNANFFANNATATPGDANDYILYNTTTGELFYDKDGTGAAAAVKFAVMFSAEALTVGDFVVI